jgi:hypothetical protein
VEQKTAKSRGNSPIQPPVGLARTLVVIPASNDQTPMTLRRSLNRTLYWLLVACLATWAIAGEANATRRMPRVHEAARTVRGASSVADRCRRDDLLRWLAADVAADRFQPEADTSISLEIAAVKARSFAPVPHVTSCDRTPARCRST